MDNLLGVEVPAGKNIDVHIAAFYEGVEADMALSDKDKA